MASPDVVARTAYAVYPRRLVQALLVLPGGALVAWFVVAGPGEGVPAGARLTLVVFVLAAGVSATGLPTRVAAALIGRAASVRQLLHLVTVALTLTAFAVPATSGRAALTPPALVALAGALVLSAPRSGTVKLGDGVRSVPWSLLLFMAGTAALGTALTTSGATGWLAGAVFGPMRGGSPVVFLVVVVALSVAAHLLVQSRTARSSVLVPLVVAAALAMGLNPVAVAFASTAAAGFCHTLTSSAKPVAMFARLDGLPTYDRADLLRLSVWLAPLTAALVVLCSLFLWPHLGLPLH